jgi:uncharacterized protein with HEPN domain
MISRANSRDEENVIDLLQAAKTVVDFTAGVSFEQFITDRKLQLALERLIDVIGQDAINISDVFRSVHSEIPWQTLMTLRHILALEDEEKNERMWSIVSVHVPELLAQLESLLQPLTYEARSE